MPRLLIHFARYGPYHHARLRAAHEVLAPLGWEVIGLETAGTDATYAWDETSGTSAGHKVITVFPGRVHEEITAAECKRPLYLLLDSLNPDAMAIAGWASPDALSCLSWCRKHDRRRIVMSETREADGKRVWWKELIKRRRISRFDAALVGGKSHRDYLVKLGMSTDKIHVGYNVVDNAYFAAESEKWRNQLSVVSGRLSEREDAFGASAVSDLQFSASSDSLSTINTQLSTSSPYFLASNRFIERKNLARLIEAYAAYLKSCQLSVVSCQLSELDVGASRDPSALPMPGTREVQSAAPANHGQQTTDNGQRTQSATPQSPTTDNRQPTTAPWNLCLLGDGELKSSLIAQCHRLGLTVIEAAPWDPPPPTDHRHPTTLPLPSASPPTTDNRQPTIPTSPTVYFPGFRQIEELPRFYAHAGCFVHPALEEPWGLVLNEAMACGLPVLSGSNVGAAEELVDDGVNGWKFDAGNAEELARIMAKISGFQFPIADCRAASIAILEKRCPTRAFGMGLSRLLTS